MTGRIIQMPPDDHRDAQWLLPWYVTGTMEEPERDRVQAHLGQCAECRAELGFERRLSLRIAGMPPDAGAPDVEHGWALISQSLDLQPRSRSNSSGWLRRLATARLGAVFPIPAAAWLRWVVAAQFCLLLVMGVALWRTGQPARYHALGAAPISATANVVVIFRPETPEQDLRAILRSSGARLVGGPTVSDAYLLRVAPTERSAALARLRQRSEVVLAEPVDGG